MSMIEKIYRTENGPIHYWISSMVGNGPSLIFLPGLTADHRLFEKQTEYFDGKYRMFVWDAPGHADSYPFELTFTLEDKARMVDEILKAEGFDDPVIVGQSMGGYVSQCFIQKYPGEAAGFISIDSAPLKRNYVTGAEIWLLKRTEPMYRAFPWNTLKRIGANGCAVSGYGRKLMRSFLDSYTKDEYCKLSGHGMKLLAEAMEADLPYEIDCPVILICGEKDRAGSAKSYNCRWAKRERIPIRWIQEAGHNSNTDKPEEVNQMIRDFVRSIEEERHE